MSLENIVIVSAARTPIGSFNGKLSHVAAPKLGADAIKEVVQRAKLKPDEVSQVFMGCVLTAGVGQAPARQAALFAGLSDSTPCVTIGKVCGSGLQAVILGVQSIQTESATIVVSGGMENMSQSPHLLTKVRQGYRMGHGQIIDSMIKDGLWDVYNEFHMGAAAEMCVKKYNLSRKEQDEFAISSYTKALNAHKQGLFKEEMISLTLLDPKGKSTLMDEDEELQKIQLDKIANLSPAFEKNGTVTAGNASKINDAGAAVLLMTEKEAKKRALKPLGRIVAYSSHAQAPEWFTTAPVEAIKKVLDKAHLKITDIDLFEINEAFAAVTMAATMDLKIDPQKVNVHGGAVALGHPIGASGARILTTLLYALKNRNAKRGLAAICIGGGEALAMIVERV